MLPCRFRFTIACLSFTAHADADLISATAADAAPFLLPCFHLLIAFMLFAAVSLSLMPRLRPPLLRHTRATFAFATLRHTVYCCRCPLFHFRRCYSSLLHGEMLQNTVILRWRCSAAFFAFIFQMIFDAIFAMLMPSRGMPPCCHYYATAAAIRHADVTPLLIFRHAATPLLRLRPLCLMRRLLLIRYMLLPICSDAIDARLRRRRCRINRCSLGP